MKILLPVSILLAAATGAAAAWFLPIHRDISGRPVAKIDAAGQAVTALPLSSLTPEEKARADALRLRVDALDAKLEAHDAEIAAGWNEIMADLDRENARRKVEGDRIASVVNATGVKPVEAQVEDLMDDTARKRVKGVGWIKGEVAGPRPGSRSLRSSPPRSTSSTTFLKEGPASIPRSPATISWAGAGRAPERPPNCTSAWIRC